MNVKSNWYSAALFSVVLMAGLLTFAEIDTFFELLNEVPWPLIACSMLLFQVEGLCTALRIRRLVAPESSLVASLQVTGWWVLGLVVLPARLGEVTGMHMVCRYLLVDVGSAFNSLVMQRTLDGLWLLVFAAGVLLFQFRLADNLVIGVVLLAAIALVAIVMANLPRVFSFLMVCTRRKRNWLFMRTVTRFFLQAARSARDLRGWRVHFELSTMTALKWMCGLAALSIVLMSLIPSLALFAAFTIAVLFSLASILPVQTIGGIGLGDISVAAALGWYGIDLPVAASAAVLTRVVLICAPLMFFVLAIGAGQIARLDRKASDAR